MQTAKQTRGRTGNRMRSNPGKPGKPPGKPGKPLGKPPRPPHKPTLTPASVGRAVTADFCAWLELWDAPAAGASDEAVAPLLSRRAAASIVPVVAQHHGLLLVAVRVLLCRLERLHPGILSVPTAFCALAGVGLLAAKMELDHHASNASWADHVGMTLQDVNSLETHLVFLLEFGLVVTPEDVATVWRPEQARDLEELERRLERLPSKRARVHPARVQPARAQPARA